MHYLLSFLIFCSLYMQAADLAQLPQRNLTLLPWMNFKLSQNRDRCIPCIDNNQPDLTFVAKKQYLVDGCVQTLNCFKNYSSQYRVPFFPLVLDPQDNPRPRINQTVKLSAYHEDKSIITKAIESQQFECFCIDLPQWLLFLLDNDKLAPIIDDMLKFHIYYKLHVPIVAQEYNLIKTSSLLSFQKIFNYPTNIRYLLPKDYEDHHTWLLRFTISGLVSTIAWLFLFSYNNPYYFLFSMGLAPLYCIIGMMVCSKSKRDIAQQFQDDLVTIASQIDTEIVKLKDMSSNIAFTYLQKEEEWLQKQPRKYARPDLRLGDLLQLNKARQKALQHK